MTLMPRSDSQALGAVAISWGLEVQGGGGGLGAESAGEIGIKDASHRGTQSGGPGCRAREGYDGACYEKCEHSSEWQESVQKGIAPCSSIPRLSIVLTCSAFVSAWSKIHFAEPG